MHYMGGKFRQGRAIADTLKPYIHSDTLYVEPFLGGANSAARVARDCKPGHMLLADIIKPLVLMHEKCYNEGVEWMPLDVTREQFDQYKMDRPKDDPMTAWIGLGYVLIPDWFHSYFPHKVESIRNGQKRTVNWLRNCSDVQFECSSYNELEIPDGAVVYCDPPYADSDAIKYAVGFDHDQFWNWVRELSQRCVVVCSTFDPPEDFITLHDWGDTVTIKQTKGSTLNKQRVESERLIRYGGGMW